MDIELLLVRVELDMVVGLDMVVVDLLLDTLILLLDTLILGVCDSEVHISLFVLDRFTLLARSL